MFLFHSKEYIRLKNKATFFTQMEYIVCIAEPAHLSNSS